MRQEIRNNLNQIIGWLDDQGHRIQAQHRTKGVVGFYDKGNRITLDMYGRIYCYGDGSQSLVRDAERNLL